MKKMTIKIRLNSFFYNLMRKVVNLDAIDYTDVLDILKVDVEQGYKILLVKIVMKPGHSIKELEESKSVTIISKFHEEENTITCLMQGRPPIHIFSKLVEVTKHFNEDVIWDTPARMEGRSVVISAIGDEKALNKIALSCKLLGKIEKISFTKTFLNEIDMLHCLTDKQRHILITAKQRGYYEYPRKISTGVLSEHVGLSKATTVEHLRKAENRLMSQLLVGY
jgi:predicted DNA binding protein